MTFSPNEIETMSKRAARGAGLSWGLAEEAGKAARWLASRGLPGVQALLELLTRNDGKRYDELAPVSIDGVWRAHSGPLCPIVSGAAICDRADEIAAGHGVELGRTTQPMLLAPFAAGVAKLTRTTVVLSWDGVVITFTPDRVSIEGEYAALTAPNTDRVYCRRARARLVAVPADPVDGNVDANAWIQLTVFAHRTLAPATDASRLAGAGARLTDND